MAKKLMMNTYSENGLMPVMNGLVCWLDGRDYDGSNIVKDRVSKKDFTVEGMTKTGYSFLYNKNTSKIFAEFSIDDAMYNIFNNDFTLCFQERLGKNILRLTYPRLININKHEGNSPYQLLYNGDFRCMKFCDYSMTSNDVFKNINICDDLSSKNLVIVKQGNNITFYKNGVKHETIMENKNTNINLMLLTLGQAYSFRNDRVYFGDIYSFMAYNKALTEEEIQQNFDYEQSIQRGE